MLEMLLSGKLPSVIPSTQKFSLITLCAGNLPEDITILGPIEYIARKLEE